MKLRKCFTIVMMLMLNFCSAQDRTRANYEGLRNKWKLFLIGEAQKKNIKNIPVENKRTVADDYLKEIKKINANSSKLWEDLDYTYSKDLTESYRRLEVMAIAYQSQKSHLYQNKLLREAILAATDWLWKYKYNAKIPPPIPSQGSDINNWWDYLIGVPLKLNNITVLMYDEMNSVQKMNYMEAVRHFTPDFTDRYTTKPRVTAFTAANRAWVSTVIALRGVIVRDSVAIAFARDGLTPVFKYSKKDDGFYRDGSFIQHLKHPYTGGYGISLLTKLAEELYLLNGSVWEVTAKEQGNVFNWVQNAFAPIIYKGNLMSMTEGREISRLDAEENNKGRLAIQAVSLLSSAAPADEAIKLRQVVKYWISEAQYLPFFYKKISIPYRSFVRDIAEDQSIKPLPVAIMYRQFANMDRAVQQNSKYAFGISMHSSRIYNYETRAGYENKRGWHTGDGLTYLYNKDQLQFCDDFWPTVNPYRLPGTTVEENTMINGSKTSSKTWVGGASMLDRFGVTGMDLAPNGQTLSAKKSWFMLDGKILALGAGIVNADKKNVHTYIEQRKLKTDNSNRFIIDGEYFKSDISDSLHTEFKKAHWAHLEGNVPGADIGYYFPNLTNLNIARRKQFGSWKDINVNQNPTLKQHYYLTLWNNHGMHITNDHAGHNEYAYVLLPGYTAEQTGNYAKNPDLKILSNTAVSQGVEAMRSNLVAANFWTDSLISISSSETKEYLSCDRRAAVIVFKSEGKLHISISDPTMLNSNKIHLRLKEAAKSVLDKDPEVEVNTFEKEINLTIYPKLLNGKTVSATFTQPGK